MRILMISAEAAPFAKTGGLADAVSALSKALCRLGHDVKVLLPRYYQIDRSRLTLCKKNVLVSTGWSEIPVHFYCRPGTFGDDADYYFVDYERLFGRTGIYGNDFEGDFRDNPLRFSMLCRSAFALCRALGWSPDVFHSHDWSVALVPVLLSHFERAAFPAAVSVLSIHNMGYQGRFPGGAFPLLGLHEELRSRARLDFLGGINFLQAGIIAADKICTVSARYAVEIQTEGGGFGLDGLMRIVSHNLHGIVNGVDTELWNPSKDTYLPARFSSQDMSGKAVCKAVLQKRFDLPQNEDVPVVCLISRLADQKGISELFAPNYGALYRLCTELNAQFIVIGSGERWCQDELRSLSSRLPNLACYIGYDEELSHLAEAGADYFLMPSKYEPCGLNQMYSMLYGTLPVVHATGGLMDTVFQYDEGAQTGTGFLFYDLTPDAIFNTVRWALTLFPQKKKLFAMRRRAMEQDFSWKKAAEAYCSVYEDALSRRNG